MKILYTLFLFIPIFSYAQSAWLPEEGRFNFGTVYVYETYDEFYLGGDHSDYPFEEFEQNSLLFNLDYGFSDLIAFDLTFGYTDSEANIADVTGYDGDDGLLDTRIGVRYQLLNEFLDESFLASTLSVRFGLIIEGSYDTGFHAAPGDGGSGYELSLHLGKIFTEHDFGIQAALGFRDRNKGIPSEIFGNINLFYNFWGGKLLVYTGYDFNESLSGINIDDPLFTIDQFPETKESSHNLQYGLVYNVNDKMSLGLSYAHTISGRNTPDKNVVALSLNFSF